MSTRPDSIPPFTSLPLRSTDPPYSAWSLYGPTDSLGTLNRLTDAVVLAAASEIQTGRRVNLDWPLTAQTTPFFGRQKFEHRMWQKKPRFVNDDVWAFNSQGSSQWDGLRHFGYQRERRFYGGVGMEEVHEGGEGEKWVLGVGHWAQRGIVARGILLDYRRWREGKKEPSDYRCFERSGMRLEDLKRVLEWQGTEVRWGDVLFIRSGYMAEFARLEEEVVEKLAAVDPPAFGGVERSEEVMEWVWENFAAVGGDMPSFESWPPPKDDYSLHEVFLAGFGCPIGELFDLEKLSTTCEELGRWSFFLTSEPCNVPGGVASPPNALAIF
ncbi:hypothetical protein M501DRAFT_1044812 [Patellaria atrata CBS 101060]|uniref:Cyclase n=1 Tax=Patellaria atrata CBS 101060 TaxID=1346257 RepID=A0A9P4S4J6_9PEZI|nr:hypothetical protein M501DRAFT_1044812 [Patellaria atrata CBS 101060]